LHTAELRLSRTNNGTIAEVKRVKSHEMNLEMRAADDPADKSIVFDILHGIKFSEICLDRNFPLISDERFYLHAIAFD
jgi:hypothetical protein